MLQRLSENFSGAQVFDRRIDLLSFSKVLIGCKDRGSAALRGRLTALLTDSLQVRRHNLRIAGEDDLSSCVHRD